MTRPVPWEVVGDRTQKDHERMEVTIHRGTNEIGGSCVEVSAGGTRLILDVGMPLMDSDGEPFDLGSTRGKSAAQLLEEGVAPKVAGLFGGGERPAAILLSHAHIDHSGLLHLTDPGIPIHATKGTSKIMLAGSLFAGQQNLDKKRFRELTPGEPFTIGAFRITPFPVDHSTFGCVAFLLEADGKTLLYSGDLRWHGHQPETIQALVGAVAPRRIDALVMEGTHVGGTKQIGSTEAELVDQIAAEIEGAKKLVLAHFSPINVDRLLTCYRATRKAGRVFVVDAYAAFVMHLLSRQIRVPWKPEGKGVRVLFNKAFLRKPIEKVVRRIDHARIELDDILAEPEKHVMVFRPSMTRLDFAGNLPEGCRCIYSCWQGYLDKRDWVECQRDIERAGGDLVKRHVSGHIYQADLIRFVEALKPKQVIPIHTLDPRGFERLFPNATVLEDGQRSPIG